MHLADPEVALSSVVAEGSLAAFFELLLAPPELLLAPLELLPAPPELAAAAKKLFLMSGAGFFALGS